MKYPRAADHPIRLPVCGLPWFRADEEIIYMHIVSGRLTTLLEAVEQAGRAFAQIGITMQEATQAFEGFAVAQRAARRRRLLKRCIP